MEFVITKAEDKDTSKKDWENLPFLEDFLRGYCWGIYQHNPYGKDKLVKTFKSKPQKEDYDRKLGEYPGYIQLSDYFFTKHGAISYMERNPERQDSKGIQRLLNFLTSEEEKEYAVTVEGYTYVLINGQARRSGSGIIHTRSQYGWQDGCTDRKSKYFVGVVECLEIEEPAVAGYSLGRGTFKIIGQEIDQQDYFSLLFLN